MKICAMKIIIVDSVGEHRGMHYFNFPLAQELSEFGCEVILFSTPETQYSSLRPANIKVKGVFRSIYGDRPMWVRGISYAAALIRIISYCMIAKPDIVHFHFYQVPPVDLLAISLLRSFSIKIVTSVHDVLPFHLSGGFNTFEGRIYRRLYKGSSGLFLHSEYAQKLLHSLDPDFIEKTTLIPHGNYELFLNSIAGTRSGKTEAKVRLGLEPDVRVLLIFGTIKPNKRLDWVLRALKIVVAEHSNLKLLIVGKLQDRDIASDIRLAQELGLDDEVIWRTEKVSDLELVDYFTAADLVLFPYEWIYQSGAIIMAMNFSRPVIATAVGSNVDLIRSGVNGLLVPPGEPDSFAEAISRVLDDSELSEQLGMNAFSYATNELSWRVIAQKAYAGYLQLLGEPPNVPFPAERKI
jgi:glycosyltransferase involved in cell wall biosynthesis